MSWNDDRRAVSTLINGSYNFVKATIDINDICEQSNQANLLSNLAPLAQGASIYFEVRKPVKSFTGRKRELKLLHKHLQWGFKQNQHRLAVISQITCISGLGGTGKSEIARMYAYRHSHDYDDVIWINSETYGVLTESFHRLAEDKLNIPTKSIDCQHKDIKFIVQEVYKYFSNRKSLFIFDNVEERRTGKRKDEGIDDFLPNYQLIKDNELYFVITSRNRNWEKNIPVITIDTFTEEEAMEFIRKELGISDKSQENDIRQLAKTLKYFPLALQQAMAYIKHKNEKFKKFNQNFQIIDYLKKFKENKRKLIDFNFPVDNSYCYIKTTFITWDITLKKIRHSKYGPEALETLEIIAYLASDNIPTKLFLELLNDDQEKMGSMLELVGRYSMIKVEGVILQTHRLAQQVMRIRLRGQQKYKETVRKALKLIIKAIETNTNRSQYLSHAISVWNHASNDNDEMLRRELIKFSCRIIHKLIDSHRYREVTSFSMRVLEILKHTLRMGHLSKFNRYDLLLEQSNQDNKILEEVCELTALVLGKEHSSTLLNMSSFALLLDNQSRYEDALRIYQEVLNTRERVLGKEHPSTLTTKHDMASVLLKLYRYNEAFEIYQESFNIKERILGKEHPDTLMTMNNLALVLDHQGRYDKALRIYREALNNKERVLGKKHSSALTTKHNIASVLLKQGRYDEALRIYQEVLNTKVCVLGKEHPDTLMTIHNIALVLDNQGRYDEALRIYQKVFNIEERVLGKEHPDILMTKHNIALVLDNQGRYDEALRVYLEVLNVKERVLGKGHPDTLITEHNIALVLDHQGKYDEALGIYQEILKIREQILGVNHPKTTKNRLGSTKQTTLKCSII